jgi:hypothetical protein
VGKKKTNKKDNPFHHHIQLSTGLRAGRRQNAKKNNKIETTNPN